MVLIRRKAKWMLEMYERFTQSVLSIWPTRANPVKNIY